jgi:ribonuclease HI
MVNRHVGTSGQCPFCNLDAEDVLHLLFKCPTAQALWDLIGIRGIIEDALFVDRSGSTVLEFLLLKKDNDILGFSSVGFKETITVGCWYPWWIRRWLTHNKTAPPMNLCRMSILTITANAAKGVCAQSAEQRWCRPEARQVKVNVDGSFHQDEGAGAIGAVIRDHKGKFIAASMTFIPNLASTDAAEALALREGLCLANRLGCSNVIAESDSLETIHACTGEERWWGESVATYADCVDLRALIGNVQFKYCPREANGVAHELARVCFSSKNSCNWVDEPPSFLLDKLINDVTEL